MAALSKSITLLQVDDDLLFNAVCNQHFQRNESVQLIQVTSIEAAELRLKQTPEIDLLMLDLSLPGRDGVEFLETLADINFTGRLVIISSQSSHVIKMAGTIATAKGLNLVARVEKPLTSEKLASLDAAISQD
jgi:two-component SAPR family response regulator